MTPLAIRRATPAPSLPVFFALQILDVLTTLIGLEAGAHESSVFLSRLMQLGPVQALLIAKLLAIFLVGLALRYKRARLVVFVNYWFAAVVTWNLAMIVSSLLAR